MLARLAAATEKLVEYHGSPAPFTAASTRPAVTDRNRRYERRAVRPASPSRAGRRGAEHGHYHRRRVASRHAAPTPRGEGLGEHLLRRSLATCARLQHR